MRTRSTSTKSAASCKGLPGCQSVMEDAAWLAKVNHHFQILDEPVWGQLSVSFRGGSRGESGGCNSSFYSLHSADLKWTIYMEEQLVLFGGWLRQRCGIRMKAMVKDGLR